MRIIKLSVISLAAMSLVACNTTIGEKYGFFKDDTQSYRRERPIERSVVIPQNLSAKNVQDYYEVPAVVETTNQPPSLVPPGSHLVATQPQVLSQQDRIRNAENAKIQGHTAPSHPNIDTGVVGLTFAQAWVKVGHLLQASNYKIVEKDKVLGTYFIVDTQGTGGKVKKDMPIYQVHLKGSGTHSTVVTVNPANAGLQNQLNQNLHD